MTRPEVHAAATALLSALATLDDPPLTGVALAVCALADVGAPLPDDAPPLAQALARFLERGVIDAELGDGELEQLDGFAPATHAATLAEALLERGVEPFHRRLPRLLLPAHADLAFRFAAKTHEPPLLLETWLAALDAGVAWPAPLQARVDDALSRTDLDSRIAAYVARLRLAARRDPVGAFALADEAIAEVGTASVEDGLMAVAARAATAEPAKFDAWLARQPLDALALCAKSAAFAGVDRLDAVSARLEATPPSFDRAWYEVTFELLSGAAALGRAQLAADLIVRTGPPRWSVAVATGKALRRLALRGGDPRPCFDAVTSALRACVPGRAAGDAPLPPSWANLDAAAQEALWRLDAEPLARAPWWTPWDGGLP
ncbi:MAG: hypothetical protein ACOZQL_03465 [Myxococcota bacterium]